MTREDGVLRIAITDIGGTTWTGGTTYRKNLLQALHQYGSEVAVYLVSDQTIDVESSPNQVITLPYSGGAKRADAFFNRVTRRLMGADYLLSKALRSVPGGVDVVFPGRFRAGSPALLFWIPDFQFLHLPQMYTARQISGIKTGFMQGIRRSDLVVLSSQDAYKDFRQFAPEYTGKARVLSFTAHIPPGLYEDDPQEVVREYHLPEKFFYLPNQFWKHKNHLVVLKALKILKEKGVEPFFVFTGNPIDSRSPLYFAGLLEFISQAGLRNQVAFLGLIPHRFVYHLIRQSICVVNPSLFEGWSTTVEETKSVGKRILLSDLPVHKEQNPPGGIFFDPHNPDELAEHLAAIWASASPGPDPEMEQNAKARMPDRMSAFAETFIKIAREAARS